MRVDGGALLYAVVGNPIKHSLSPVFQNAAFERLGLNALYAPLELPVETFEETLRGLLKVSNFAGCNLTVPFKERVLALGDRLSEEVEKIGSANTLKKTPEGTVELYNTDWLGFLKHFSELTDPKGKKVLVLGAGGTARAVVYALKRAGARVWVWNRTPSKARKLASDFGVAVADRPDPRGFDAVVNTTSVGMRPQDPPLFDYSLIEPGQVVYDVVYEKTPLVEEAKRRGARAENGLKMLLYQGVESFKIWTGLEPPVGELWKLLKE
ncbi:MAG: shikimate dehydrogenase, partial [Aquificae bacterium]|nr:shikimate dehydrogenase [Aquificota bacterium]